MTDGIIAPENPPQDFERMDRKTGEANAIEADALELERSVERLDDVLHAESAPKSQIKPVAGASISDSANQSFASSKDPVVIEVEKILEDGIGSFYTSMPDRAKMEFKQKGEAVALEISEMVKTFHAKVKKLIRLISGWLKTIPGVNKFFLEQEAKIKADRIMELIEARKHDQDHQV